MGRVLMATWDGGGNVPPLLGIGRELSRRGHDVLVIGHEQQRGEVEGGGLRFAAYRHARPFSRIEARDPLSVFRTFADGGAGRDVSETLQAWPAEVVVVDALLLGPLQAAEAACLPTVALFHTFYAFTARVLPSSPVAEIGGAQGRLPEPLWDAAAVVLVAADRELDPDSSPTPPNVHWTGVVQDTGSPASPEEPGRILLSLSTVWWPDQQNSLQTILDAVAGLPVTVLATAGPNVDAAALRVPPNVEVHDHLDHREVMPTVSLVIGHGGHATTMLALAHDLPLLVVPQWEMVDQPMIGQVIAAHGAGLTLPQNASVDQLREAITKLLREDSYRRAAAVIGTRLRAQNGAAAAADRIEALVPAGSGTRLLEAGQR
jgi:UDP:flavonoid glycosyltransferase YjiC (YdhE family)